MIRDKNVVLGVTGGIAVYKSVELLRLFQKQGARVRVMMTKNAQWFVGPMTFEALSRQPVCDDLFDGKDEASIRHIDWADQADLVVVAPATANILGKLAHGIADDALSTFLMAVTCPVVLCPAMNTHMYESRANQRNLKLLGEDGFLIVPPDSGELACGTTGPGRLPAPEDILDRVYYHLSPKDLKGRNILITAGPTQEMIDPVRFISNPSSGKMGYAIARAAEYRGANVTLVSGPCELAPPKNVTVLNVRSALEMADAVYANMADAHIIIKSAAVSDYRPVTAAPHKIKKDKDTMTLEMEKNPDILFELGQRKKDQILVGFAAETQELKKNATDKLTRKNLDMIVGNIVGQPGSGFASDTNRVTFFFKDGAQDVLDVMEKDAVAHALLDRVVNLNC